MRDDVNEECHLKKEFTFTSASILSPFIFMSPQVIHVLFCFDTMSNDLSSSLVNTSYAALYI